MIIKFTKKEALTCSFCFSNKPSFQMISLEPVPGKDGGLVSTCTTTFLCDDCLKSELDDFHRSLRQSETPLGEGETEDESLSSNRSCGCPDFPQLRGGETPGQRFADRRTRMRCELTREGKLGLWQLRFRTQLGRAFDS
jgi:hypothetical protein